MSLFHEPEDGPFDVSGFPSPPTDFLWIAIPVIELAVRYGRGVGLRFFHERPQVLQTPAGPRVVSPNVTALFGMGGRARDREPWLGCRFSGTWSRGNTT